MMDHPIAFARKAGKVFLTLRELVSGNQRYFYVSRKTQPSDRPDAVICVPIIEGNPRKLLCSSEYRIVGNCWEFGFFAGIIDDDDWVDEDIEKAAINAAIREVSEETNGWYTFTPTEISPRCWSSLGMTDESVVYVFGIAKRRLEQGPERLESEENIIVFELTPEEIKSKLNEPGDITFSKTSWTLLNMITKFGLDWVKNEK